jgi:hypothetical protein
MELDLICYIGQFQCFSIKRKQYLSWIFLLGDDIFISKNYSNYKNEYKENKIATHLKSFCRFQENRILILHGQFKNYCLIYLKQFFISS